jgi:CO/xanthine dehydrogenase FAD-binding subunit
MRIEKYVKPKTVKEAYHILIQHERNTVIGGGAWLKQTKKEVHTCIDLTEIGLTDIIERDDCIEIGAMTSLRQIEINEIIQKQCNGILNEAINHIMGVGIRNIATIGGSVVGKYAFSDILTPLFVMDASFIFYKQGKISIKSFLEKKKLEKDILLQVIIPKSNRVGYFHKCQKTRLDFALVNLAVTKGEDFKVAIGARPGVTYPCLKTMQYLNDSQDIDIDNAVQIALQETTFSSNSKASSEYRKLLVKAYLKRGLSEVMNRES